MIQIHDRYYNIEQFKEYHPGGSEILELCKNEPDCTALFESYHAFCNMNKIKKIMKQYELKVSDKKCLFSFAENGFYNTCKNRVKQHFNRQNSKADIDWGFTVLFSLLLFLYCQYICLYSDNYSVVKILYSILSGITLLSLGYNVLHDGSHYAISTVPWINNISSMIIQSFVLFNHILWSYHHCIRHHQYTGYIKYDPDIRNSRPFFRKSNSLVPMKQEYKKKNIGLKLLLFNIFFPGTTFGQSLAYHLQWVRKKRLWKMNLPNNYFDYKTILQYMVSLSFIGFEIYNGGFYFIFHIIGTNIGFFIGSAPDHDMYSTHLEIENANYRKDWGELQVRHSGNFMSKYTLFTRFYGGINYQIEHHLFPTLNNHKLKKISPIVQQCCKEFNIPYHSVEHPLEVYKQIVKTYQNTHSF